MRWQVFLCLSLLAGLILECSSISAAPDPFCQSQLVPQDAPLLVGEQFSVNLGDIFTGYNLRYEVLGNSTLAKVNQKGILLDENKGYLPGLIVHGIDQDQNKWGKYAYLLYRDFTGSHRLSFGSIKNSRKLPDFTTTVTVTNNLNVSCFGAVIFSDHGMALVDCLQRNKDFYLGYKNFFYLLDLATFSVIGRWANPQFGSFTNIVKRELTLFRQPNTGQTYLLRAHLAEGVDTDHQSNSFLEIFLATDPQDIQLLKVIDRSYLHLRSLTLMDVSVYLGDIFMLDKGSGLYRLDILQSQQIAFLGKIPQTGFSRFAVYSNDLEYETLILLANSHAIYEFDWHDLANPILIVKYSLLESSYIRQLIVNDQFVIVQSAAKAYNQTVKEFEIDYTWIFSRSSRSYINTFMAINHNSSFVEMDYNREEDLLIFADEEGLRLWEISQAYMTFRAQNTTKIPTDETFAVVATSSDPNTQNKTQCQIKMSLHVVERDNMTIWPTGRHITLNYSVNAPGSAIVLLDDFMLGPNLSFKAVNISSESPPTFWIDKINITTLTIDKPPIISEITFFYTEVIPDIGMDHINYFYQDVSNTTHVAECDHYWFDDTVDCKVRAQYSHNSRIAHFTTTFFPSGRSWEYYYLMNLAADPYTVRVIDFNRHRVIAEVNTIRSEEGRIGGLAASNGYLYVLLPLIKSIQVYDMKQCSEVTFTCPFLQTISASTLKPLGVPYFAPVSMKTDRAHPQVLFISCRGSLLILDIDNHNRVVVLDEIVSEATKDMYFRVAMNLGDLIITAAPDRIEKWSLRKLYTAGKVELSTVFPTYGHKIQPGADVEFSDANSMVYVNAFNPQTNKSAVLIYRTGHVAANSLYDIVNLPGLYSRPGFEIEVSGFFVDFMSIIYAGNFELRRVFDSPLLHISGMKKPTSFNIQITNPSPSKNYTSPLLSIYAVNGKLDFTPTKQFNETISNLKLPDPVNSWSDRLWYEGSVLSYNYSCRDCPPNGTVRLRPHVDEERPLKLQSRQYVETFSGGISVADDLFRFWINGSVRSVYNLPDQSIVEMCNRVASTYDDVFIVTGCVDHVRGVNLYVTSAVGFKGSSWGPFKSSAWSVNKLQIVNEILMLVDTPNNPENRLREGAVYLYALDPDPSTDDDFDELEIIDSNDFFAVHGWNNNRAYLGNAYLVYDPNQKSYRLYVTEIDNGVFIIDFTRSRMSSEISVKSTFFVDMKELLKGIHMTLPMDATFQAVTFVQSVYHPTFDTEKIIVTTRGFHQFELMLIWSDTAQLMSTVINRVYYRYADFDAYNEVESSVVAGMVAIGYTQPTINSVPVRKFKQVIAVYDTNDYPHESQKGYSERYILGAYKMTHQFNSAFSFNTTYDRASNGTRVGLVIADQVFSQLHHASLSKNISVLVPPNTPSQMMNLTAYNEYYNYTFSLQIVGSNDEEEKILFIVAILVLCGAVTLFFIAYIISEIRRRRLRIDEMAPGRQSLLSQEQSIVGRDSVAESGYSPPQSSDRLEVEPTANRDNLERPTTDAAGQDNESRQAPREEQREISRDQPRETNGDLLKEMPGGIEIKPLEVPEPTEPAHIEQPERTDPQKPDETALAENNDLAPRDERPADGQNV